VAPNLADRLLRDVEFLSASALPQALCQETENRSLLRAESASQLAQVVTRADLL
jgi:hypothetical protein